MAIYYRNGTLDLAARWGLNGCKFFGCNQSVHKPSLLLSYAQFSAAALHFLYDLKRCAIRIGRSTVLIPNHLDADLP